MKSFVSLGLKTSLATFCIGITALTLIALIAHPTPSNHDQTVLRYVILWGFLMLLSIPAAAYIFHKTKLHKSNLIIRILLLILISTISALLLINLDLDQVSTLQTSFLFLVQVLIVMMLMAFQVVAPTVRSVINLFNKDDIRTKLIAAGTNLLLILCSIALFYFVARAPIYSRRYIKQNIDISYITDTSTYPDIEIPDDHTVIATSTYYDLVKCYNNDHRSPLLSLTSLLGARVTSSPKAGYYIGEDCSVLLIADDENKDDNSQIKANAILAEIAIREFLGDKIITNSHLHPSLNTELAESGSDGPDGRDGPAGSFNRTSKTIFISRSVSASFYTLVHEELHAFASTTNFPVVGDSTRRGLNEAITTELTNDVLAYCGAPNLSVVGYQHQLQALPYLYKVVDREDVVDAYFNSSLSDIGLEFDSKTFSGGFCIFADSLNRSAEALMDHNDFEESARHADNAIEVVEGYEGSTPKLGTELREQCIYLSDWNQ